MATFDLFLVPRSDATIDAGELLNALEAEPALRVDPQDASRCLYYDDDTAIHFQLVIAPELVVEQDPPQEEEEYLVSEEYAQFEDAEEEDHDAEDDDRDEDDEDDEDDDDPPMVDLPPVSLHLPIFVPSHFIIAAMGLVERLRTKLPLEIVDPQEDGAGDNEPGPWSFDDISASWRRTAARFFAKLEDRETIQRWSAEECRNFFGYGSCRGELQKRYAAEDLDVLRVHPARCGDQVASVCIWNVKTPAVLPRSHFVLLQRAEQRRGLLARRTRVIETVVSGPQLWKILGPFAEVQQDPAPHIVFRRADDPPDQVVRELEKLETLSSDSVKRTELNGVVDFDLPPTGADG